MDVHPPIEGQIAGLQKGKGIAAWGVKRFDSLLRSRLEPFLVTGGLYISIGLYYTRVLTLQIISALLLCLVAFYWGRAIKGYRPMTLTDFKLTRRQLGRQVLIGLGLAFVGWFFFRYYVYYSRGVQLPLGFSGSMAAILSIVVVASAEEIFFRGYLQNRLSDRYGFIPRVVMVVIALSLYKNIIHLWTGMPLFLHVELFAVSVLLSMIPSLLMEWTGNLTGPIVLHVVWDLLVYGHLATIPYWVY